MAGNTYQNGVAVTPSDTVNIGGSGALANLEYDALYIGGAGSGGLKVLTAAGQDLTFAGLTANTLLPIRVKRVYSTGTNVTNIVALTLRNSNA
jgi:hypothetical protein